jgi:hypothetical protein
MPKKHFELTRLTPSFLTGFFINSFLYSLFSLPYILHNLISEGSGPSGFCFIQVVISCQTEGLFFSTAFPVALSGLKFPGMPVRHFQIGQRRS